MLNELQNNGTKVLHVLEMLLFLSPAKEKPASKDISSSPDDIKNRVLLKIERAEIMSAMVAMRSKAESEETTSQ